MKDKLRIGVIGAGRWAGMAHIPGWKRSPLVDLAVICDIDREKAEARAKEFDVPGIETDYQKVLSSSDIDVVVGQPYIFNGWEQNSQWIDPASPSRFMRTDTGNAPIKVGSLEGYGAPTIDISLWVVRSRLVSVVGVLKNFVPKRKNPDGTWVRTNVDDGDIYIGEYANGAICSMQSSYVTVGNYPGIEARVYGSNGALICRLVGEVGECQV